MVVYEGMWLRLVVCAFVYVCLFKVKRSGVGPVSRLSESGDEIKR